MAEESTKVIRIVVDSSRAVGGGRDAQRALEQIEKSTGSMAQAMDRAMGSLRQLVGLFGAGFSAKAVIDAADAFTKFNNSLQVAGTRAEDLTQVQNRLFSAANRNGVEIGALGQLYSGVSLAARELGVSQEKILQFTEGVTAALRLQGTSTEQASGALLQLSQALGGGVIQAEEFNSLLDGAPAIVQAAARGIDRMHGSVTQLRAAVRQGTVTSKEFLDGTLKGFTETERQAASMNLTVGAALTVLQNGFTRLEGEVDKASGATSGLAKVMADLGQTMNDLSQNRQGIDNFLEPILEKIESTRREIERLDELMKKTQAAVESQQPDTWATDAADRIRGVLYSAAEGIARWNAYIIEAFRGLPGFLGDVFTEAMNAALAAVEAGVNKILAVLGPLVRQIPGMEGLGGSVSLGRLSGGTTFDQYRANVLAAGDAAASRVREARYAEADRLDAQRQLELQASYESDEARARRGGLGVTGPAAPRVPPPPVAGKQSGEEKSYDKLIEQLKAAAKAQDDMTAAAIRGDVAFQEQTIHAQAVEKAIGIFGKALDDTDPRLRKIEELISRATFGKLAEGFAKATNELESQNEVLEAQLRLMNEAPDIQAREIALIKIKQEVEKAGGKITEDEINRRKSAIEQNETLKLQADQMKQANDLWLEPLRQGLRNIQSAGADAWETILETGNFTFQSLGEVFTKTLRRMAAEFLALATIRPVLSLAVDVIGPNGIGLLGGNGAAQLGFPVGAGGSMGGGGGLGGILGGGGGSLFGSGGATGGGWLARQFSGVGDWLASPVSSLFGASATPAGGFADVGSLLASGQTGASAAATGGLSIGSALGGIGSIGMGAFGLLRGGGNTASTIGSIGQIVGGGLMMVPGLQPVGAALSLLSGILPGLFGGGGPKIPPMPALAYGYGGFTPTAAGGYSYSGDSLGSGSALTSQAQTLATSLTAAFKAAGLGAVPGSLIGGGIASGTAHLWNGKQWQDSPYTQTGLINPDGSYTSLTANDTSRSPDAAAQYLLTQVFKANVMQGGVSGAGAGLKAGLETINPVTTDDLNRVIALGTAYDKLGQAINPAKDAIDKISASFDDLKAFATEASLSLDPINDELAKQSKRSAQDFIDAMLDPLAVQMRALDDERSAALESAKYIKDNIEGVYVDLDRITDYYGQKRLALEDQFYQGGITNLQALIDRLSPGGNLANLDPSSQLAGLKASYQTTLDKARTGDASSIANLANVAGQYAEYGQSYFAGSAEYTALRDQIIAAIQEVRAVAQGDSAAAIGTGATIENSPAVKDLITAQQRSQAQIDELASMLQQERADNTALRNLLSRYLTTVR